MDKVEIKEYQNLSEPVRVTVVTGLLNMEGVRVPAGGKEGQNLTKKSDKNYDVYWADPDDINSIEHITLNGEEVPVENKTAKITVDKSTVGLDNVDNTADVNKPVSKLQQNALSRLNEAIAKNPEKLYLTWKGYNFPYSSDTRFTMPAGSYIDWGDGVIDAFTTIRQSDSTDTQVSFGVLNKPDNVSKLNHGINDVDYTRKENVTCVILNNENDVITLKSVHDITSFDYVDITLQVCDESDSENEYSIYSGDIEFNQTIDGKTPRGSHWETIRLSIDQLRQGGSYITDETITSAWKACQQFKTYYEQDNALFLNFGTHFKGQEVWVYIADIRWGIVVPSAVRKVATENTSTVATHMYTGDDFILTHLISIYGLSQIPEDGFIHASYLIDIRFPTDTIDINYRAFCLCQNLTRIELPHTRNIGEAAFLNSNFIKYVRLGQWVKSIGDSAFSGCDQIEKFYIDADTPPTLGKNAFYYTSDQLKIIVPKSSIDAYKSAAGWSTYADKIVYEVDSSDLDKAITDLDVDNIAYLNKDNTFKNSNYFEKTIKVRTAPVEDDDVVRKLELDTKYDKTGGTIGGNVVITGDLTVNGTQHINNTENLNVENAMIYSNATGATLATNGGIGIKKNATDVYGIVYDPTSDSVKLGIGKSDANGRFTFNANEGNPVAVRDDSSKFTNNNLVKWDSTNHKFVDSGKKIDDLSTATNLENGTGLYSLVQRCIKNDIDHSSIATGIGSVAFGGLRFDYDPTKHSGDTTNTAAGGQSFVAGCGNYAAGDWSFVTGKDNTVYSNRAFISGGANISQAIDDEGNFIKEKTNAGRFNAIFGNNNTFKSSNTLKESNLIAGGSNTVDTERSIVVGYNNNVTGSFDAIFGSTNVISADYSLTGGRNHVVSGGSHLVAGSGNEVSGQYNIASGQDNQNLGWNSAVIGRELIVGKNHTSQIILGQYNDNKSDTVLEIGWGNPDNRKNVFEVLQDGRAKVQTAPTENNDVLRYQDTAVEVETSLMGA